MPITHENQLRWRKLWMALSCAQASIVVYLSLTTRPHHLLGFTCGDKIEHLVVFFMLTFWISQLYSGDRARQRIAPASYWLRLRWKWQRQIGGFADLEYGDIAEATAGVNATGNKPHYYSLNTRAADFGYQPALTSLNGILQESEIILNRHLDE